MVKNIMISVELIGIINKPSVLVVFIIVLVMHGHTNIELNCTYSPWIHIWRTD